MYAREPHREAVGQNPSRFHGSVSSLTTLSVCSASGGHGVMADHGPLDYGFLLFSVYVVFQCLLEDGDASATC
jgi:hypothetical protein